ncbi:MAG TPA: tyrosine-type recombinase/integrase [Planctomycetota bacterium]|nr:tyrosine-type recombinase/integrase [Planctomycetota bacterium]
MQLQEALQAFLLQLSADGRSPHTIGQYRRHGTALATWLAATGTSTTVAKLTPDLLARFFAADAAKNSCRGGAKKAVSLNAMRTSIRCFASHLHQSGLVATNPARLLRRARCAPPPPRALHPDEQARLLKVLANARGPEAERDRMLVELLLGTGVRIGSALALDIGDIDFAHGEIALRQTKNDRPATAVLPSALAKKLKAFVGKRADGPLFLAGDRRVSTRHAQRRLAGWLAKAGIVGRSAHSLRHCFAASLLARTGDLRLVQAALNHASIVSTTIYTLVDRARLRAAVGC